MSSVSFPLEILIILAVSAGVFLDCVKVFVHHTLLSQKEVCRPTLENQVVNRQHEQAMRMIPFLPYQMEMNQMLLHMEIEENWNKEVVFHKFEGHEIRQSKGDFNR